VRLNVGEDRVCICIVWQDEMEMRWCLCTPRSAKYILLVTLFTSVTPVSPYTRRLSMKIYLEALIECGWGCTRRPGSSEFRDALGYREIEWTQSCTRRPWLSEYGDALRDGDRVKLLLTMMGDTLGGHDRTILEEYLEAIDLEVIELKVVNLEVVNLEAVNLEAVDQEAWALEADSVFHW